jgi:hypothetical protein
MLLEQNTRGWVFHKEKRFTQNSRSGSTTYSSSGKGLVMSGPMVEHVWERPHGKPGSQRDSDAKLIFVRELKRFLKNYTNFF